VVKYRRNLVPGGTYFFTVAIQDRSSDLLVRYINQLRASFRAARESNPFTIDAIVILPDHLHCLWTLPVGDSEYSHRWRLIQSRFSRSLNEAGLTFQRTRKGEYHLWQRRFWEHTIRDEADFETHVNYIHYNPVKHKLVTRVTNWPYSSFHHFVQSKQLDPDWAGDSVMIEGNFGE